MPLSCWKSRLLNQSLLTIVLAVLVLCQGSFLNYYIISHYSATNITYFFFLGDFLAILFYVGTLTFAYRHLTDQERQRRSSGTEFIYTSKRFILQINGSKFGVMPCIYAAWAFYSLLLLGKVAVIFLSGIPEKLSTDDVAGPQLLKVTIALSGFIFLVLVEGHNWGHSDSPRYVFITGECRRTGVEILDTVSLLCVLIEENDIENMSAVKYSILVLSGINFLLPLLPLYKLSLGQNCLEPLVIPLNLIHTILHFLLIDIPFLSIRLFLWTVHKRDVSIFLMKNVYGIISSLRSLLPALWLLYKGKKHVVDEYLSPVRQAPVTDDEEQMEELNKINKEKK